MGELTMTELVLADQIQGTREALAGDEDVPYDEEEERSRRWVDGLQNALDTRREEIREADRLLGALVARHEHLVTIDAEGMVCYGESRESTSGESLETLRQQYVCEATLDQVSGRWEELRRTDPLVDEILTRYAALLLHEGEEFQTMTEFLEEVILYRWNPEAYE